jgi:hypothetical protein
MRVPKRNPRHEYRLRQREQIEASPSMAAKFPQLHGARVVLEYYDAAGSFKSGEMKCKLNVEHARSLLWFECPAMDCMEGDFELSNALAHAVEDRRKLVTGEIRCQGKRKRGEQQFESCGALLRYKLSLDYD